jgi:hypothetical protein
MANLRACQAQWITRGHVEWEIPSSWKTVPALRMNIQQLVLSFSTPEHLEGESYAVWRYR